MTWNVVFPVTLNRLFENIFNEKRMSRYYSSVMVNIFFFLPWQQTKKTLANNILITAYEHLSTWSYVVYFGFDAKFATLVYFMLLFFITPLESHLGWVPFFLNQLDSGHLGFKKWWLFFSFYDIYAPIPPKILLLMADILCVLSRNLWKIILVSNHQKGVPIKCMVLTLSLPIRYWIFAKCNKRKITAEVRCCFEWR